MSEIPDSTLRSLFDEDANLDDIPDREESSSPDEPVTYRRLHNEKAPNIKIKHEKFAHRQLAYLIGSGRTQSECAIELGYTDAWVSQICRQPWFQDLVLEEITRTGRSVVDELIKNAAPGSVLTLLELRDSAQSETVRSSCAKELLNRYLGNTTVVVRHEEQTSGNAVEEVERLEREANRLRAVS